MWSAWRLLSCSFSLGQCVGTFLIQSNTDTVRSDQFTFPPPLTHVEGQAHMPTQTEVQREERGHVKLIDQKPRPSFFNQNSTASEHLFLFPLGHILLAVVACAQICLPHCMLSSSGACSSSFSISRGQAHSAWHTAAAQ